MNKTNFKTLFILAALATTIPTTTKDHTARNQNSLFSDTFFDDIHNLHHSFFTSQRLTSHDFATNLYEEQSNIIVEVSVPGLKQDDIEIEITNQNILKISGTRKYEQKSESAQIYQQEISYGQFAKSFKLPKKVNDDAIIAEVKDGILTITLPIKESEKSSSKKIAIK